MIMWKEEYSTHNATIDEQHKKIFNYLHELEQLMENPESDPSLTLHGLLNQIIDYTQYHFTSEEQLMEAYGYPNAKKHALEHIRLMGQLADVIPRVDEVGASSLLAEFVQRWIVNHIIENDLKYAPYLKDPE